VTLLLGLDYSSGRLTGTTVVTAGYRFVVRYLDNGLPGRSNLTAVEATNLRAAGVGVVLIWETTATRATTGHSAGVTDATAAAAAARQAGLDGWPIYFTVDFDLPDYAPTSLDPRAKLGPVAGYFDGVRTVLSPGRVGGYGGYWAVKRLLDANLVAYSWQSTAWSGGHEDPRINLFQRLGEVTVGGVACDVNEARQADYGQNGAIVTSPQDIAKAVWEYQLTNPGYDPNADPNTGPGKQTFAAGAYLTYGDFFTQQVLTVVNAVSAAVQQLAAHQGLDPALVQTTIDDAVAKALAAIHVTVTSGPTA
jgi:hypothetical protein